MGYDAECDVGYVYIIPVLAVFVSPVSDHIQFLVAVTLRAMVLSSLKLVRDMYDI